MCKIESYKFGNIVIKNTTYTHDVIILKDKINKWWRKTGHLLCLDDLILITEEKPEIIIIGTGAYGMLKVPQEVINELTEKGIKIIIDTTKEAIEKYNKLVEEGKNIAGAFHITC